MDDVKKYLIVCFAANDWVICNSDEDLARQVGRMWMDNLKRDAKADGIGSIGALPFEVYELGGRLNVRLKDFEIESITPKPEA